MGLCLMAVVWSDLPVISWNVLKVVIALGMVIFVHELGHFLVAKLCGVKCEKFYLGFDIGGLRLWKYRRGETEYGIGILPLGGYVKMLGQEDNPARLREEVERAKANSNSPSPDANDGNSPSAMPSSEAEAAIFDPRSYLAQSVPKRMAIISAGVVMNVLFALFTAVWAYWLGIYEVECGVGAVIPGAPAWQADLKVGDRIRQIRDASVDRYKDLRAAVSVGDIEGGVPMLVQRQGAAEPLWITVHPKKTGPYPTIGVLPPMIPVLDERFPVRPGTPAAAARPGFRSGDRIVAIDGQPISNYAQIHQILALHPEKTLSVTIERGPSPEENIPGHKPAGPVERITMAVGPAPVRDLGMVMEIGKVTAIQSGSPAEAAGILPGDTITRVDGQPVGDPLALPERLRVRASKEPQGAAVTLAVIRPEQPNPLDIRVKLQRPDGYEIPVIAGNPVSVAALGIAYDVSNRVSAVAAAGPAAQAGVRPGDVVTKAKLIPPDDDAIRQLPHGEKFLELGLKRSVSTDFGKEPNGWPAFLETVQNLLPGGTVELTLGDGRTAMLRPVEATGWYHPERGFLFEPKTFFSGGQSLDLALRLGTRETIDSMTLVYRFLGKLGTQQVSPTAFGGPISIFALAYGFASQGFADLLMFLTIIGANLAVINFLPIPVLDGGHMVFLAYEGITGKPPSERVHLTLTYLGLLFILALMLWVLGLDIVRYASSLFDKVF